MKWETVSNLKFKSKKLKVEEIVDLLLENRGLKTEKEKKEFFNTDISSISPKSLQIDSKELKRTIERIGEAVRNKEQIVVFGDYDVDGICGTAILWETLNALGAKVLPYIPSREEEGYGLSIKGIENLKLKIKNCKLIITVDNGIVANKAVNFAKSEGIDVIITDHHTPSSELPNAYSIIHTIKVSGAGVAWLLSQEIRSKSQNSKDKEIQNTKYKILNTHLELVAIASIADMVPLKGETRRLTKAGLEELKKTKRLGLLELFKESGIDKKSIKTYQIGYIIAPRINAMGRIDLAMDSLRLICTFDRKRAQALALKLESTNKKRQDVTEEAVLHAKSEIAKSKIGKLLFIGSKDYQQGIIGLVAGKLVEEYYRPSIVFSKGEEFSKASARSISDFNIIEFIRQASDHLIDSGGHPMAAGFTFETTKFELLRKKLEQSAETLLSEDSFIKTLKVDCEIPLSLITFEFYDEIIRMEPFGIGNPQPVFVSRNLEIKDLRTVGMGGRHLKIKVQQVIAQTKSNIFEAIGFGIGEKNLKIGDTVDLAYIIDLENWNGNKKLILKLKDVKLFSPSNFSLRK